MNQIRLATELEIRDGVAEVRAALGLGQKINSNIWAFYSNKNNRMFTILGDVGFIFAVLLEGNPSVTSYETGNALSIADADNEPEGARELHVRYKNGKICWYQCGRYENLIENPKPHQIKRYSKRKSDAEINGATFEYITERNFANRMMEFSNWLTLCSAMTRARNFSCEREAGALVNMLQERNSILFHDALSISDIDPALMIRAIARGIACGEVSCDLSVKMLTEYSVISKACKTDPVQPLPEVSNYYHNSSLIVKHQNLSRRTKRMGELWSNIAHWPKPIPDLTKYDSQYLQREYAVRMYINDCDSTIIERETGLSIGWVRKLFVRCVNAHPDGRIWGFRALVLNTPQKNYTRSKEVPTENLDNSHGGYSGAFKQLLVRHPEVLNYIESSVLTIRKNLILKNQKNNDKEDLNSINENSIISESRIRYVTLQQEILRHFRSKGLTDTDYPFNTKDRGYSSLRKIANSLLYHKPLL